jgi:hypothetical protein
VIGVVGRVEAVLWVIAARAFRPVGGVVHPHEKKVQRTTVVSVADEVTDFDRIVRITVPD